MKYSLLSLQPHAFIKHAYTPSFIGIVHPKIKTDLLSSEEHKTGYFEEFW